MGRGTVRTFVLTLTLVLAGIAGASCQRTGTDSRGVVVLAFDGLDYELVSGLMAAGRLPSFARLAREGGFGPLATTAPPQSPVAWSTFTTGLEPHDHGIFDFVHRDPRTLAPYLSTTRSEKAGWTIPLGPWQVPLGAGRTLALRTGEPFWARPTAAGRATTIVRMPANYPPSGAATRELSGMGTPDLLGTYGTFSFFTSGSTSAWGGFGGTSVEGGTITRVQIVDDVMEATLRGPDNPLRREPTPLGVSIVLHRDARAAAAKVVIGGEERVLNAGEWSDWIPVAFPMAPLQTLRGMCRVYLKAVRPEVELYVSPINIDPRQPALPVSAPAGFAGELAASAGGRYYTQGMPEDTKAYVAGVLTTDEFLAQAAITAEENRRQYRRLIGEFRGGLLFHYFGHVDQVSHVLWRSRDPEHPAYDAAADGPYRGVIDELYAGLDRVVGETLDRVPRGTLVVVMSDHGFASWRRAFNLNAWLEQRGYLALKDPSRRGDTLLAGVDWSRTRAYGLGLNGLYVNVRGREREGIVEPSERAALADEMAAALLAEIDPATGRAAVTAVHRAPGAAPSPHGDREPDLIVGYAKGTRASNASALGGVPIDVIENNTGRWSGDHCMDPRAVPGVLLASRALGVTTLQQLGARLVRELEGR